MGEEHRDTLTAMTSLAVLYPEEGKLAEAEPDQAEEWRKQQAAAESVISSSNLSCIPSSC